MFTGSELVAAGAVGWMTGLVSLYCWYWRGEVKKRRARYRARQWTPNAR